MIGRPSSNPEPADQGAEASPAPVSIRTIQNVVAKFYRIEPSSMAADRRSREIVRPRQVAMYLACTMVMHQSTVAIGRAFGGRDHTTVMYARNRIADLMAADRDFRDQVALVREAVVRAADLGGIVEDSIDMAVRSALAEIRRMARDDPIGTLRKLLGD